MLKILGGDLKSLASRCGQFQGAAYADVEPLDRIELATQVQPQLNIFQRVSVVHLCLPNGWPRSRRSGSRELVAGEAEAVGTIGLLRQCAPVPRPIASRSVKMRSTSR